MQMPPHQWNPLGRCCDPDSWRCVSTADHSLRSTATIGTNGEAAGLSHASFLLCQPLQYTELTEAAVMQFVRGHLNTPSDAYRLGQTLALISTDIVHPSYVPVALEVLRRYCFNRTDAAMRVAVLHGLSIGLGRSRTTSPPRSEWSQLRERLAALAEAHVECRGVVADLLHAIDRLDDDAG